MTFFNFLGCDCSGKDTLMHKLAKKYQYKFYMSPRSPICNIVYDVIYHRTTLKLSHENWELISEFLKLGAYFILVYVKPEELLRRAKQRNEKHVNDLEAFKRHTKIYNKVFLLCKNEFPRYSHRFLKIDNTNDLNKTVNRLDKKIGKSFL